MALKKYDDNKIIDVVLIYQERGLVEQSIKQIQELDLKLLTLAFDVDRTKDIVDLSPKVILLSTNNVVNTIKFYIEFLENNFDKISNHKVLLLINNKETTKAYLACESGLFDNYVVINPLNDPYRLKLAIKNILSSINTNDSETIKALIKSGEDELIACIDHGKTLKISIENNLLSCKEKIVEASKPVDDTQLIVQKMAELTFNELNQTLSTEIQSVLDRMVNASAIQTSINSRLETHFNTLNKPSPFIKELATSELTNRKEEPVTKPIYKLLIAEHSVAFVQVISEIFDNTDFQYDIARDGVTALLKIKEFEPDVILLAYDLPNIDGIEVTKRIREERNSVPIVAFSHHNDKQLISKWVTLGLSGYLIKPSTQKNIFDEVLKAVKSPIDILKIKSNTRQKLEWIPEYSVGNTSIDEQHKVLFDIINDFFQNTSKDAVVKIFNQLSDYIFEHFKAEEMLLENMGYPKLENHKQKHDALIQKFNAIRKSLPKYSIEEHHKIAMFLYTWLSKHILSEDMEYKNFAIKYKKTSFIVQTGSHI